MFFVNQKGHSFDTDSSAAAFSHAHFHFLFIHKSYFYTTLLNRYIKYVKSKLSILKSASQKFLFMKVVSGDVTQTLEADLNSVKLCLALFFFPSPECLHSFCCLDLRSDTFMCQLIMFFVYAFPEIKKLSITSPSCSGRFDSMGFAEKLPDHRAVAVTSYKAWPGAMMVCSECGREGLVLQENKISILASWVSTISTSLFSVGNSLPVCLAEVMMLCEIQICSDNRTVV